MKAGDIIDISYVIDTKDGDYITANVGVFRTKYNAEKRCNLYNRCRNANWEVKKVKLVVVDEQFIQGLHYVFKQESNNDL